MEQRIALGGWCLTAKPSSVRHIAPGQGDVSWADADLNTTFLVLRTDAVANVALAVITALFANQVAEALGVAIWPIYALALLMAVNGVELWMTPRSVYPTAVVVFAVVDAIFVVGAWALPR